MAFITKVSNLMKALKMGKDYVETALYVKTQFRQAVLDSKVYKKYTPEEQQRVDKMVAAVDKYADLVIATYMKQVPTWDGKLPLDSDLKKLQAGLADEAMENFEGLSKQIFMDYAIKESPYADIDGHFVRGYSTEDGDLPKELADSMDQLFNAWLLTEENITTEEGFFYGH